MLWHRKLTNLITWTTALSNSMKLWAMPCWATQDGQVMVQRVLTKHGPLEKEMASHSSILAWRIPWTEESGGLQSVESQRVGHDRVTITHWWSILLGSRATTLHLPAQVIRSPTALCTGSSHTGYRSQGGQKQPCPSNTGDLCSDHWLLFLIIQVWTKRQTATVVTPPPPGASPSSSSWSDCQGP